MQQKAHYGGVWRSLYSMYPIQFMNAGESRKPSQKDAPNISPDSKVFKQECALAQVDFSAI